jgi:hypothetical protein
MAYSFSATTLGAADVAVYTNIAPGITNLPSTILEPQLGEIRHGWDGTNGWAEFIYLKVPKSTAITAGLLYQWTAGYAVAVLPVLATSKNTGHQVALANATLASDAANVNYGWFQISGQANVLKTAVTVSPDSVVYASATAGRIKVLTSAGGQITGLRTANAATVTSTTSSVLCYMNRPAMQGQIT